MRPFVILPLFVATFLALGCTGKDDEARKKAEDERIAFEEKVKADAARQLNKELDRIQVEQKKVEAAVPKKDVRDASKGERYHFGDPQMIGNVRAWVFYVKLSPVTEKVDSKRVGEPCWTVGVYFQPVNGRREHEFADFMYEEAGLPRLTINGKNYAFIDERFKQRVGAKKKATADQKAGVVLIFEATPDPVESLHLQVPTQLVGHEGEYFEFTIPGKSIDREDWDKRKK